MSAQATERRTWRIVVPVDPVRLSHNARLSYWERAKMTKSDRGTARTMWQIAGSPVARRKVLVSVIVRRCNPLDPFNAWDGLKAAMDGLFNEALTPNDSAQWIEPGTVRWEEKTRPEVEFIIEEIP